MTVSGSCSGSLGNTPLQLLPVYIYQPPPFVLLAIKALTHNGTFGIFTLFMNPTAVSLQTLDSVG